MPFLARTPVVAALAAIAAAAMAADLADRDFPAWQVVACALVAAAAILQLPRRPVLTIVLVGVDLLLSDVGRWEGESPELLVLAMLLGVYRIGEIGERRTGILTLLWITVFGQIATIASGEWYPGDILFAVTVYLLPWLLGRTVASSRHAQAELEARTAELEAERRRRASFEVARERERLAARVNGVVSEALRSMVDEAGRGLHVLGEDRVAAGAVLEGIEGTGRDALREMRALLGVLREEPLPAGEPAEPASASEAAA